MGGSRVFSRDGGAPAPRGAASARLSELVEALQYGTCPLPAEYEFGPGGCFVARVASDLAARRAAAGLLAGQCEPPLHDLLPGTTVLLAEHDGRTVGCAAAYADGPLGLPMERSWPRLLQPLRGGSRQLSEISSLAVIRNLPPAAVRAVMLQLLKLACLAARRLGRATDVVAVLPKRRAGLIRRLGLLPLGEPRDGGIPVRLELDEAATAVGTGRRVPPGRRGIDEFLHYDAESVAAWLRTHHRPLREMELSELLAGRRESLAMLGPEMRHHFHDQYLAYELGQCQEGSSPGLSEEELLA